MKNLLYLLFSKMLIKILLLKCLSRKAISSKKRKTYRPRKYCSSTTYLLWGLLGENYPNLTLALENQQCVCVRSARLSSSAVRKFSSKEAAAKACRAVIFSYILSLYCIYLYLPYTCLYVNCVQLSRCKSLGKLESKYIPLCAGAYNLLLQMTID